MREGKYLHYKGNFYEVIGFARHSESLEDLVVYKSLTNNGDMWVRPAKMFFEEIEHEGKIIPRFQYIE